LALFDDDKVTHTIEMRLLLSQKQVERWSDVFIFAIKFDRHLKLVWLNALKVDKWQLFAPLPLS